MTHLWQRILLGIILGIALGALWPEGALALQPLGDIFLNLIRMIVVPLVFGCIISGLTSIADPKAAGRLGFKAVSLYLFTSIGAVCIGLAFAELFRPGDGIALPHESAAQAQEAPSLLALLVDIFPSNPFASMAEGNMLQVITFAILVGLSINLTGDKAEPFKRMINAFTEVMIRMTRIIMQFAPVGIFALLAMITARQGLSVLMPLLGFLLLYYLACAVHVLLVYGGLIRFIARLPVAPFLKKMPEAQLFAFSTSSSAATLPVTLRVVQEKLGISRSTASFVLPMGMTVNMDGSALNYVLGAVFVAQAAGIDLTSAQYAVILFTSVITSIGMAGVPAVAASGFIVVLSAVNLPLEGIALILVVDRLMDMLRTAVNVTGDAAVALTVDRLEGRLDEAHYRQPVSDEEPVAQSQEER